MSDWQGSHLLRISRDLSLHELPALPVGRYTFRIRQGSVTSILSRQGSSLTGTVHLSYRARYHFTRYTQGLRSLHASITCSPPQYKENKIGRASCRERV